MIKLENVTKRYGNVLALDNVSFEINEGEIVGLLGPNGAGKSTTMNIITGFIEQTSGKVTIDGYDTVKKSQKAKKQIGYMPEGVPLYGDLTVKEFVTYMAELKGVKRKEKQEKVQKALQDAGLENVQNKLTKNLSRGYKQRVSLAGTLVSEPKVIILDEPTVGLDPKQVTEIREVIKRLGKKHTVILSSHILSEVSQICNRVIIINKGKIVAIDTPENLENKVSNKNVIYVTVEDIENKVSKIKDKISGIKEIKLVRENEDKTKQYSIEAEDDTDLRKSIFENFAKESITIFEMKKADTTLEDAFMQLIEKNISTESSNNVENLEKKLLEEEQGGEK
ncbi:MAG: ABC transporter ATP-binding protein [Clostridia bacterium]|nr:ABC transporter ATP-binding protein [Clostridia bacterium]